MAHAPMLGLRCDNVDVHVVKLVDRGPGAGGRSEEGRKVKTPQFTDFGKIIDLLDHVGLATLMLTAIEHSLNSTLRR